MNQRICFHNKYNRLYKNTALNYTLVMMTKRAGFTILETMIVLAVSSAILVSTILIFSGQQRRAQFTQGLRDIESKLREVQNDVSTGKYPAISGVSCSADYTNLGGPILSGRPGATPGTSLDCMLMGKAVVFNQSGMDIYTLIGNRYLNTQRDPVRSTSEAKIRVAQSLTENYQFKYGVEVYDRPPQQHNTLVFISSVDASRISTDSIYESSNQVVRVHSGAIGAATPTDADIRSIATGSDFSALSLCVRYGSVVGGVLRQGITLTPAVAGIATRLEGDLGSIECI
jgi:type II secretory pathway pseudopilin PulG